MISSQDQALQSVGGFALEVLGTPTLVADDGRALPGLGPGKTLAMLVYLAVRGRARRDELIDLLWGEIPEAKARNAFRQSLHRLRSVLSERILPQDRDQLALATDGSFRTDRDLFLAACDAGRWDAAVARYRGEFLTGLEVGEPAFDRWADGERVRLRARFQEALLAAGRQATSDGNYRDALQFAERLTATAPYDEEAAVFEANTLVAAGRLSQALSVAHQFVSRKDELGIEPSSALRSLIDRLERRKEPRAARADRAPSPDGARETRFIGRDSELSRMLGTLARVRAERGATILLEGDAGIGKTRLLDEFVDRARSLGGVSLFRGREAALGGVVPYAGVAEALRPIVRASGVSGASRHLLAEAARLFPELRDSFDLPAVGPVEDETGRLRFFEGIAAIIDAAAYERPVCIVLDDIHNASASTIDLIVYLSQRLHESPVLLVVAYRSERNATHTVERIRELAAAGRPADLRIELDPLGTDDMRSLVREALAGADGVTHTDVERIATQSAGRPVAAQELVARFTAGELPTEVPAVLRDILWARFQSASPFQRRLFFAASLLSRSASLRLLAAAAHLPEVAAFEAAAVLARAGLLRPSGDGYVVAHDCATTFLVDSSGLAGRALLAGWAADALSLESDQTDSELAALYALAGRGTEAFTHARSAAFAAATVGAAAEATRLLGIALTFAPNESARREIDSLLTAFGRDHLRLAAPVAQPVPAFPESDADEPDVVVEPLDAPAQPIPDTPFARPIERAPRVATARQWVASIAISLAAVLAYPEIRRAVDHFRAAPVAPDTLMLAERDARGQSQLRIAVTASNGFALSPAPLGALGPAWIDSLRAPFTAPLVSPDQQHVAIGRMTAHGQDLIVVSADRRDTLPVAVGASDNVALAWSPDGRAILFSRTRTLSDGSLDSDLLASWIGAHGDPVAIDTSASRSITEARWSPAGDLIAWVARSGLSRQRDVFVSRADGSDMRNVSANPADDYDINWSPDGSLLAFTSSRGGGTRLYVYDFEGTRLWPVSDANGEEHAMFSPNGRSIAFESTRDGDLGVYTRPALGGTPHRLTPVGRQFSIVRWSGTRAAYLDRLRIIGGSSLAVGDTARFGLLALFPNGTVIPAPRAAWRVLDASVVGVRDSSSTQNDSSAFRVVAKSAGSARLIAAVPGWRSDTLTLVVGSTQSTHIEDDFSRASIDPRWLPLGSPLPRVGVGPDGVTRSLYPNGDLEWDSGVLLRSNLELREGLRVRARLFAPFTGRSSAATLTIGLVPAQSEQSVDRLAPQFSPLVSVVWDGASGNLTYAVGQRTFSEPAGAVGAEPSHAVEMAILPDRSVTFSVDGRVRWSSTLNFLGDVSGAAVQLWIGGRATSSLVAVSNAQVDLSARTTRR